MKTSEEIVPWIPELFQEWTTVQAVNRYFTPSTVASANAFLPLDALIDPVGILAALQTTGYHYTSDNQVGYFERVVAEDDLHFQYVSIHLWFCPDGYYLQIR
jgi:hypothetical protein